MLYPEGWGGGGAVQLLGEQLSRIHFETAAEDQLGNGSRVSENPLRGKSLKVGRHSDLG